MATIKIDEHGSATVTMANGRAIPVPTDYETISVRSRAALDQIIFADGAEWWVTTYRPAVIPGLSGDIEDGATFIEDDGSTWTRYGDEMFSAAPRPPRKEAA
ncbi:MAG: hypothetical protein ACOY4R_14260 [Pseudomonadota bacterium]